MKYTPDLHPWSPLTVAEVISVLDGVPGLWWLSGGCAIDEYLGSPTREHGDIDVTWPATTGPASPPARRSVCRYAGHSRSNGTHF
ncbi:MAG: hypothetical protein QOD41_1430, partial [Cryptosporangiaceae bacterium]|nr:hypothetical protein [Cryptosporangiaceae bacterium]